MIQVDVTKFGNIPNGGGWRYLGKQQGDRNRAATDTQRRKGYVRGPLMGTAFVHTVIDDHSRVAYAEIHADEKAATAIGVLQRAAAWFADYGVTVERVLTDNGSAYRSHAWREAWLPGRDTGTNTSVPAPDQRQDRRHRTLADGWAYARFYDSETARRAALPDTAIGGRPPITRMTNLPGHHN